MSGVWGNNLKVSIFGESHGPAIGASIHNLPAGLELDQDAILKEMARRAPGSSDLTTPRKEKDQPEIISGFLDGKTTGAPLTAIIWNTNTRSKDYSQMKKLMRPGQADYPGKVRYQGYNDYRGSGHFSGRITAPLVFAGAIAQQWLEQRDIYIGSHVQSISDIQDQTFQEQEEVTLKQLQDFKDQQLPLFDGSKEEAMTNAILEAKEDKDSIGIIACGNGFGISYGANIHDVRVSNCINPEQVISTRSGNDANILALGARFVSEADALTMVDLFLSTEFGQGLDPEVIEFLSDSFKQITKERK